MEESSLGKHTQDTGPESQRRDERDSLFVLARIRHEGDQGDAIAVRVRNVSSGGLMADVSDDYRPGARVEIILEGIGTVAGSVAWAEAGRMGIAFDHPIDKARARKPAAKKDDADLYRPRPTDYRRPPLKPR